MGACWAGPGGTKPGTLEEGFLELSQYPVLSTATISVEQEPLKAAVTVAAAARNSK